MSWSELNPTLLGGPLRVQSRGEGLPLLWTHGMFHPIDVDDHTTVGGVLGSLLRCRVVRYDVRGLGRSPPAPTDDAHTWDRLADDLLALADSLELDRFIAGGISMGAAVSLHAAVKAPSRMLGLLLLAPPTGWDTRPPQLEGYRALAALTPQGVVDKINGDLAREKVPVTPPLKAMLDEIGRSSPLAMSRVLRAAAKSDLPRRADLEELRLRSLLLPWENDSGHPISTAREIACALRGSELEVVGGTDDREGILGAMQRFLDGAPR